MSRPCGESSSCFRVDGYYCEFTVGTPSLGEGSNDRAASSGSRVAPLWARAVSALPVRAGEESPPPPRSQGSRVRNRGAEASPAGSRPVEGQRALPSRDRSLQLRVLVGMPRGAGGVVARGGPQDADGPVPAGHHPGGGGEPEEVQRAGGHAAEAGEGRLGAARGAAEPLHGRGPRGVRPRRGSVARGTVGEAGVDPAGRTVSRSVLLFQKALQHRLVRFAE